MDLSELLHDFRTDPAKPAGSGPASAHGASPRNVELARAARRALEEGSARPARLDYELTAADHAFGATLAGDIARGGFPAGEIAISCRGVAGQGFGFAATRSMRLRLEGYANDTVGAALGQDARIVIVPPPARRAADVPHLVGNAAAYGATGGVLYVAGKAGQRFGVRNSGAVLVAEGVGKYAFEYMTGGLGVVLGRSGSALCSGLTGGEVAVYDPDGSLERRVHADARIVSADESSWRTLQALLADFVRETGSPRARDLLERWETTRGAFRWVRPREAAPAPLPVVVEEARSP
jgi:glutamate synthase domain-containing protein 3